MRESRERLVDPQRVRVASEREFRDTGGRRWTVYERTAPTIVSPLRSCLIFDSQAAIRRVSQYPADWMALDRAGLELLSWGR